MKRQPAAAVKKQNKTKAPSSIPLNLIVLLAAMVARLPLVWWIVSTAKISLVNCTEIVAMSRLYKMARQEALVARGAVLI